MQPPFSPVLVTIGPVSIFWYGLLIATGIMLGARRRVPGRGRGREPRQRLGYADGRRPDCPGGRPALPRLLLAPGRHARVGLLQEEPARHLRHLARRPGHLRRAGRGRARCRPLLPLQEAQRHALPRLRSTRRRHRPVHRRWGNYMNRELYGPPTTLPGLDIPPQYRIVPYTDLTQYPLSTRFHPTFLYESLACFILCILLIWIATRMREASRRRPALRLPWRLRRHPLLHRDAAPRRLDDGLARRGAGLRHRHLCRLRRRVGPAPGAEAGNVRRGQLCLLAVFPADQ